MRLGLVTALLVVVGDSMSQRGIIRTVGHATTRTARSVMRKDGDASELSEQLAGVSTVLLCGHLFDSIME